MTPLALTILIFIVGYYVLFDIISKATYANNMMKEQLRQSIYLEAIAKKSGVSEIEIAAINASLEDKKKEKVKK